MNAYKFGASMLVMGVIALPAAADGVYYDTARVLAVTTTGGARQQPPSGVPYRIHTGLL